MTNDDERKKKADESLKNMLNHISFGNTHVVAITDQAEAGLLSVASILSAYYKALIDGGIPEDLAAILVAQMAPQGKKDE